MLSRPNPAPRCRPCPVPGRFPVSEAAPSIPRGRCRFGFRAMKVRTMTLLSRRNETMRSLLSATALAALIMMSGCCMTMDGPCDGGCDAPIGGRFLRGSSCDSCDGGVTSDCGCDGAHRALRLPLFASRTRPGCGSAVYSGAAGCDSCDTGCDNCQLGLPVFGQHGGGLGLRGAFTGIRGTLSGLRPARTSACDSCDGSVGCDSCAANEGCDSCDGSGACDSCDRGCDTGCAVNAGCGTDADGCDSCGTATTGNACGCDAAPCDGNCGCDNPGCSKCHRGNGRLLGGLRIGGGIFQSFGDCNGGTCASCGGADCNGSCGAAGCNGSCGTAGCNGSCGFAGCNGACGAGGFCGFGGHYLSGGAAGQGWTDCGGRGCGLGHCRSCAGHFRGLLGGHRGADHPYGGEIPHTANAPGLYGAQGGSAAPTYAYPYYTIRGPRDFLMANPPTIGR